MALLIVLSQRQMEVVGGQKRINVSRQKFKESGDVEKTFHENIHGENKPCQLLS